MPIDFTGIKTTGNRKYEEGFIAQINDSLQDIPIKQRAAILGSIIEESGGDPLARSASNTYQGLLQWGHDRYNILPMATTESELPRQIEYIRNTIHNTTDGKSWTHGGEGSGYSKGTEAHDNFNHSISPLDPSFRAFSYGYVRPKGKESSYKNRLKVAQQVYDRLHEEEKKKQSGVAAPNWEGMQFKPKSLFSNGGPLSAWNNLSMAEKAEMIGVAVRNGITSLPEIRAKYNEFAEGGRADIISQHTEPDANLYAGGGYMEKAKAMIRANEGWRSKPYKDAPKGKNWRSVGYGFNDSGFWERYPEGISKHYENGITKAQAEKELDYFLGKAERQLKGIYGKRWNSFNDNQKAAILDTYYQRPASVGSKSGFYGAVMSGKDGAPYLGVQGFGDRNQSRRDLYRGRGISAPVSFESIAEPVPDADVIHFEPLNPQAFGMQLPTYQAPVIDTIDTIDRIDTIDKTYDPAAIEKQERQDNLRRFGMFMSMLDGTSGQDSGMPDFIDMLAGRPSKIDLL